ncbi:MAG: PEP-CTERM sorting domain-containing protein [Verrucomicrobiales bacterium]
MKTPTLLGLVCLSSLAAPSPAATLTSVVWQPSTATFDVGAPNYDSWAFFDSTGSISPRIEDRDGSPVISVSRVGTFYTYTGNGSPTHTAPGLSSTSSAMTSTTQTTLAGNPFGYLSPNEGFRLSFTPTQAGDYLVDVLYGNTRAESSYAMYVGGSSIAAPTVFENTNVGEWGLVSFAFSLDPSDVGSTVDLDILYTAYLNWGAGNTAQIDLAAVRMDIIPEPGSSTLLALAGLTTIMRRRKA